MAGVKVYWEAGLDNQGIGIKVLNKDATLFDLLEAWQLLGDDPSLNKRYANKTNICCGCLTNCCNTAYVIPDLISFKAIAHSKGIDYLKFLKDYFNSEKLKVGLAMFKSNPCIFLKDGKCTIYSLRTLLCRFYLCTDLLSDTEQLVYYISWVGMTAAQLYFREAGMLSPDKSTGYSSLDKMFLNLLEEYKQDANVQLFIKSNSYHEIPLKPFLDSCCIESYF